MEERGVDGRFLGDKDAAFPRDGFVEGVDGRVIDPSHGTDGLGENGGAGRRDEELDRSFQLIVFSPIEPAEGMGPGGRQDVIRARLLSGQVFHDFRKAQGQSLVGCEQGHGVARGQGTAEFVATKDGKGNLRKLFRQKQDLVRTILFRPEDIDEEGGGRGGVALAGNLVRAVILGLIGARSGPERVEHWHNLLGMGILLAVGLVS